MISNILQGAVVGLASLLGTIGISSIVYLGNQQSELRDELKDTTSTMKSGIDAELRTQRERLEATRDERVRYTELFGEIRESILGLKGLTEKQDKRVERLEIRINEVLIELKKKGIQ